MILDLSKKYQITFLGRKKSESGPERLMTAISFGNNEWDAIGDVQRRFDVWLVQSAVIVP